jgi:hypothetical protein
MQTKILAILGMSIVRKKARVNIPERAESQYITRWAGIGFLRAAR